MDKETKKQVLIDFNHRCSICGKACSFEDAHFVPWKKVKLPAAKDLICLCLECFKRVNKEKLDENELIKYKTPYQTNTSSKKFFTSLQPKTTVVIILKSEIEDFKKKDQEFLQSALSAFLNINLEAIQIKSVKDTPIEVTIELPTVSAEVLLESFNNQNPQLNRFLSPILFSAIERKPVEMRWLTDEELNTFRKDYRELENEIQNFFRAYYLSGLILVAAWLIGQSKPLLELSIGNGGYNIFALLGIALLNMIATTYLLHKSIAIHEVAQFMTYLSKPDSVFNYWESWRRSPQNHGKKGIPFYYISITALPLLVSCLVLFHVGFVLISSPEELLNKIKEHQIPQVAIINNPNKSVDYESMPIVERQKLNAIEEKFREEQKAYADQVKVIIPYAGILYIIIFVAHGIPVFLIIINSYKQKKKWNEIQRLRDWDFLFQNLTINPATIGETLSNKGEFVVYTKDSDKFICELTESELKLFIERIKEEADKKS